MNIGISNKTEEYCCLNGTIVPIQEAKIPITDIGLLRGYAIFDSIAAMNGTIIFFDEHFERFERSAKIMHLTIPISKRRIETIIYKLMRKNHYDSSRIKLVLTGGKLVGGLDYDVRSAHVIILVQKGSTLKEKDYHRGVKLITYEHQREISAAKSNDYITAVNIQSLRRRAGAAEILYTFDGKVLEATTSNFFIVKGDRLITAKKDILLGIVRGKVIRLAKKFMDVEERIVKANELRTADEAFITSTYKKVLPVARINNLVVGNGRVGQKTKLLMEQYACLEKKVCS
jgi:branched-subunit amino acid aminotransferase/4-amino-4-deoxychorismate lyase